MKRWDNPVPGRTFDPPPPRPSLRRPPPAPALLQLTTAGMILGLLLGLLSACSSEESTQTDSDAPCTPNERRCSRNRIFECGPDGKWISTSASCPGYTGCGEPPELCRRLPPDAHPQPSPIPKDLRLKDLKGFIEEPLESPVCEMFDHGVSGASPVHPVWTLSEEEEILLGRCVIALSAQKAAERLKTDPRFAKLPEARLVRTTPSDGYGENLRLTFLVGSPLTPDSIFEVEWTHDAPAPAPPDTVVGRRRIDELGVTFSLRYYSATVEGRLPTREILARLFETSRKILDLFSSRSAVRTLQELNASSDFLSGVHEIWPGLLLSTSQTPCLLFRDGPPGSAPRHDPPTETDLACQPMWPCVGRCHDEDLPFLQSMAERCLSPHHQTGCSPPADALNRLNHPLAAFTVLIAAERLRIARRLERPLAPEWRLGYGEILLLMARSLPESDYAVYAFALARSLDDPGSLAQTALEQTSPAQLDLRLKRLTSTNLESWYADALRLWVLRNRSVALARLMELYPRYAAHAFWGPRIIELVTDSARLEETPFLLDRLKEGSITPKGALFLLSTQTDGSESERLLSERLDALPPKVQVAILDFWPSGGKTPSPAMLRSIQRLHGGTTSLSVLMAAHQVIWVVRIPGWDWPARPPEVDRYAAGVYSSSDEGRRLEEALASLPVVGEDHVLRLVDYGMSLNEEGRKKISKLLWSLSLKHPELLNTLRRVARLSDTPEAARMANESLADLP